MWEAFDGLKTLDRRKMKLSTSLPLAGPWDSQKFEGKETSFATDSFGKYLGECTEWKLR